MTRLPKLKLVGDEENKISEENFKMQFNHYFKEKSYIKIMKVHIILLHTKVQVS